MKANTSVFITGATGFVGSHLAAELAERGARVRALVRATSDVSRLSGLGAELVRGSLEDAEALARGVEDAEIVFHLAAVTHARTEADYVRANAAGTRALVEAVLGAKQRPRRLVYLSSLAAVGPALDGRPVGRDDPPRPLTAYGRSKLEGERACLAAATDGLETVALRAPAVYGPGDREMLRFFRLAARGLFPLPAGGERVVQLVHVTDLARALVAAGAAEAARGVYHVAEPKAYTWTEVAAHMAKAVGRGVRIVRIPRPAVMAAAALSEWAAKIGGGATMFNREKARELLAPGWLCETETLRRDTRFEARIAVPDGLAATAAWYREQGWL